MGNKYGFIDKTGRFVIEPKYEEAGIFQEGLAWVKSGDKYYYIDKTGRIVVEPYGEIIGCGSFHEGLAYVTIPNRVGFINKSGQHLGPWFECVSSFHEGLACVETRGNKHGYVDKTGKFVIEPHFGNAFDFHDGRALVTLEYGTLSNPPRCGFIDKNGRLVIRPEFKYDINRGFSEGLAAVNVDAGEKLSPDDKHGYIDKMGRMVIEPKFKYVSDFHEGVAFVNLNGKRGVINKNGQFVFTFDKGLGNFGHFCEGLASISLCDGSKCKYGFIDKAGNIAISPKFEDVSFCFHEGLASVNVDGKYGFIDKTGRLVIEPRFDGVSDFCEGFARVKIKQENQRRSYSTNSRKEEPRQRTEEESRKIIHEREYRENETAVINGDSSVRGRRLTEQDYLELATRSKRKSVLKPLVKSKYISVLEAVRSNSASTSAMRRKAKRNIKKRKKIEKHGAFLYYLGRFFKLVLIYGLVIAAIMMLF